MEHGVISGFDPIKVDPEFRFVLWTYAVPPLDDSNLKRMREDGIRGLIAVLGTYRTEKEAIEAKEAALKLPQINNTKVLRITRGGFYTLLLDPMHSSKYASKEALPPKTGNKVVDEAAAAMIKMQKQRFENKEEEHRKEFEDKRRAIQDENQAPKEEPLPPGDKKQMLLARLAQAKSFAENYKQEVARLVACIKEADQVYEKTTKELEELNKPSS